MPTAQEAADWGHKALLTLLLGTRQVMFTDGILVLGR